MWAQYFNINRWASLFSFNLFTFFRFLKLVSFYYSLRKLPCSYWFLLRILYVKYNWKISVLCYKIYLTREKQAKEIRLHDTLQNTEMILLVSHFTILSSFSFVHKNLGYHKIIAYITRNSLLSLILSNVRYNMSRRGQESKMN